MSIRQDEVFEDCRDLVQSAADGRGSHSPKRGASHVTSSDGGEGFSYLTCSLAVSKSKSPKSPQKLVTSTLLNQPTWFYDVVNAVFSLDVRICLQHDFKGFRVSLVLPFPGSVRTSGETGVVKHHVSKRSL